MADLRYTVTDLGTLPGYTYSSAKSINDAAQIIGTIWVNKRSDKSSEFLWERGHMRRLLGGASATAINNKGQVVGTKWRHGEPLLFGIDSFPHAVTYENGKPLPLFELDADFSRAEAINDSGQVAGCATVWPKTIEAAADARSDGYIWQDGECRILPLPPGYRISKALAINNLGSVVGTASCPNPNQEHPLMEQAVLWEGDDVTLLGIPSGFNRSEPVAINSRGQVLVHAFYNKLELQAEIYRRVTTGADPTQTERYEKENGPITVLESFLWKDGHWRQIEGRSAHALNDHGQVVGSNGTIDLETGVGYRWAFLWQDGEVLDLNSLIPTNSGWELTHANGINNHGQIVGNGYHNKNEHAFLLTPVTH